jgi:glucuronate isomerase
MPYCLGNALYHWSHLGLKRYFNIDLILNEDTADGIWESCNDLWEWSQTQEASYPIQDMNTSEKYFAIL